MEATVSALLNQQINKEFYSAYLYLDIANFYASKGLDGCEGTRNIEVGTRNIKLTTLDKGRQRLILARRKRDK